MDIRKIKVPGKNLRASIHKMRQIAADLTEISDQAEQFRAKEAEKYKTLQNEAAAMREVLTRVLNSGPNVSLINEIEAVLKTEAGQNVLERIRVLELENKKLPAWRMNEKETAAYQQFQQDHKECQKKHGSFPVTFTGCGIGTGISVKCTGCMVEKDITDIDSW